MALIINGIDFDKRCDDAKHKLHLNIEWHAQMLGIAKYFDVKMIVPETPEIIKRWQEFIEKVRKQSFDAPPLSPDETAVLIEHARKHIEYYVATHGTSIEYELIRIKY